MHAGTGCHCCSNNKQRLQQLASRAGAACTVPRTCDVFAGVAGYGQHDHAQEGLAEPRAGAELLYRAAQEPAGQQDSTTNGSTSMWKNAHLRWLHSATRGAIFVFGTGQQHSLTPTWCLYTCACARCVHHATLSAVQTGLMANDTSPTTTLSRPPKSHHLHETLVHAHLQSSVHARQVCNRYAAAQLHSLRADRHCHCDACQRGERPRKGHDGLLLAGIALEQVVVRVQLEAQVAQVAAGLDPNRTECTNT